MKILLISSNTATTPYPVYPLGMGVVAAALKHAGHQVALFDWLAAEQSFDALRKTIAAERPGMVGISIRNIDNVNALNEKRYTGVVKQIVNLVHELANVPVVLGGSGYSLSPEPLLRQTGADFGIAGEGEKTTVELVAQIAAGRAPAKGTVIRSRGHLRGTEVLGAYYDRTLLQSYLSSGSIAPVQTKRGCRLRCVYCSYPTLEGGDVRTRPASEVVDDVQKLSADHGVKYIFFADSLFNDDTGHYLELLAEMKRRNVKVPWSAFLSPVGLTPEVVCLMRETGLVAAELGTDAASDTTLRGLRKPFCFEDARQANDVLMKQGIGVAHYFMFGGPGETPASVLEGIENIRSLRCTAAFVFLGIRILPHTELHELSIRDGIVTPNQELLEPAYYISPAIDRAATESTLADAFKKLPHVIYPPDAFDDKLQLLHKLGYAGSLWDLLGPASPQ
jgi:lipid biosynthesis B12-binding/radical SAM protein